MTQSFHQMRILVIVVAFASAIAFAYQEFNPTGADAPAGEVITVTAEPFVLDKNNPDREVFGSLKWRGGLILKSDSPNFGGISGLLINEQGNRITAVTDQASWITANLSYVNGRVKSLRNVKLGPLQDHNGRRIENSFQQDAEAITRRGSDFLISFERQHRIAVYADEEGRPGKLKGEVELPKGAARMGFNDGLEALHVMKAGPLKGRLVTFAEKPLSEGGDLSGWLVDGSGEVTLGLKQMGGFAITDVTSLEDGALLVLERYYRRGEGVKMRLRLVSAEALRTGAVIDGQVLFTADTSYAVDNMEALAVYKDSQGREIITVVSDDNFNNAQKTLLMQFELDRKLLEKQ